MLHLLFMVLKMTAYPFLSNFYTLSDMCVTTFSDTRIRFQLYRQQDIHLDSNLRVYIGLAVAGSLLQN